MIDTLQDPTLRNETQAIIKTGLVTDQKVRSRIEVPLHSGTQLKLALGSAAHTGMMVDPSLVQLLALALLVLPNTMTEGDYLYAYAAEIVLYVLLRPSTLVRRYLALNTPLSPHLIPGTSDIGGQGGNDPAHRRRKNPDIPPLPHRSAGQIRNGKRLPHLLSYYRRLFGGVWVILTNSSGSSHFCRLDLDLDGRSPPFVQSLDPSKVTFPLDLIRDKALPAGTRGFFRWRKYGWYLSFTLPTGERIHRCFRIATPDASFYDTSAREDLMVLWGQVNDAWQAGSLGEYAPGS
ncbi:hypothetical protein JCM5350_006683 [Sporobolomyces pararoseus]